MLVNGTLIDGSGAAPLKDAVVVIQDGKISAAGSQEGIKIPEHAQRIDLQGATLLPGFINAHVHGAYNLTKLAAWAQEGVTTVRDLGAHVMPPPLDLRDRAAMDPSYARLVSAGVFITPKGGYPIAVFGGRGIEVSNAEGAAQAVNAELDQGVDLIKISLESGAIFGQGIPMFTPEELAGIIKTAHGRGVRVSAHISVAKDLVLALDAGVDDMAHMITDPLPADLVQRLVSTGITWEPTIELWKNVGQGMDRYVIENLRSFARAGGKVALGTDYEGYYTPFQLGMPIKEMEWMLEAGLSPMQIIEAGTRQAAYVCGLEKELGTLEAGMIADILVVQGDPLQDIHVLANVRWVIHNGSVIRFPG